MEDKARRLQTEGNENQAQNSQEAVAAGEGVDFVDIEDSTIEIVAEEKAQVWHAEQKAAIKAKKEGKDWKKAAGVAGEAVLKTNDAARRRRLMEL